MGVRAEGLACADPGARTPIGASGNFMPFYSKNQLEAMVSTHQFDSITGFKILRQLCMNHVLVTTLGPEDYITFLRGAQTSSKNKENI
jgi:hypothetical protein